MKNIFFIIWLCSFSLSLVAQTNTTKIDSEKLKESLKEEIKEELKYLDDLKKRLNEAELKFSLKQELEYVKKILQFFRNENQLLEQDKQNAKRSRSGCIITNFEVRSIITEKIEGELVHKNKKYNWKLYYYKNKNEPIVVHFQALPHFLKIDKKEVKKDIIQKSQIIFGNDVRNILEKYKTDEEISNAINENLIIHLKKCEETENCKDCWMIPICNE